MPAEQTITRRECAMCGRGFSNRTADDSPHFSTIGDEMVICPGPIAVGRTYFAEDVIREWIDERRTTGSLHDMSYAPYKSPRQALLDDLSALLDDLTTGGKD